MGSTGLRFGRYEALFRIARGGMAEVFAARVRGEAGFEKLVAVKRILPHLADDDSFVAMFLDEARVAASVSSPHVVQTLDLGRADDGALYIVMELVVGVTLAELIVHAVEAGGLLPPEVAVSILIESAVGLHEAHEAKTARGQPLSLVHRDISPQNVLVGVDGRARVTDFGIARVALERLTHTRHGQAKGKFAYFSPEQSMGEPLDRRSDVFALGVVAWEAFAGRRLFSAGSAIDTIRAVREGAVPPLSEVRSDLPDVVERAVARALQRSAGDRFDTAAAFATELRRGAQALGERGLEPDVAGYLERARIARLIGLEERIQRAVHAPTSVTQPAIELSAATEGSAEEEPTDPSIEEALAQVGASRRPPPMPTVPERPSLMETQPAGAPPDTRPPPPGRPESRRRLGPFLALGVVVALAITLAAVAIGGPDEPGGGSGGPPELAIEPPRSAPAVVPALVSVIVDAGVGPDGEVAAAGPEVPTTQEPAHRGSARAVRAESPSTRGSPDAPASSRGTPRVGRPMGFADFDRQAGQR